MDWIEIVRQGPIFLHSPVLHFYLQLYLVYFYLVQLQLHLVPPNKDCQMFLLHLKLNLLLHLHFLIQILKQYNVNHLICDQQSNHRVLVIMMMHLDLLNHQNIELLIYLRMYLFVLYMFVVEKNSTQMQIYLHRLAIYILLLHSQWMGVYMQDCCLCGLLYENELLSH